ADGESLTLTPAQTQALARPEDSIQLQQAGQTYRVHWIPRPLWSRWKARVHQRLAVEVPSLPPARISEQAEGVWVITDAAPVRATPWLRTDQTQPLVELRDLVAFLGPLAEALEALHAEGYLWPTFDPRELEQVNGGLRFTNLDLEVFPMGRSAEGMTVNASFVAPEICRGSV